MSLNYLDFELPIAELEAKIEELQNVSRAGELDLGLEEEVSKLKEKSAQMKQQAALNATKIIRQTVDLLLRIVLRQIGDR